jgi:phage tail tape-measure protein
VKEVNQEIAKSQQDMARNQKEVQQEIRALRGEIDNKIKKALDNPLNN